MDLPHAILEVVRSDAGQVLSSRPCGQPCKETWRVSTAVTERLGRLRPPSEIAGLVEVPAEVSDGDECLVRPLPKFFKVPMSDAAQVWHRSVLSFLRRRDQDWLNLRAG